MTRFLLALLVAAVPLRAQGAAVHPDRLAASGPAVAPATDEERATPVSPGAARAFQAAAVAQDVLANGLKLAVVELRRLPLVSVRLMIPFAGPVYDPAGKAGLSNLVAELMNDGAGGKDSRAFAEAVDDLGAEIAAGPTPAFRGTPDALVVSALVLKDHLDEALGLVADMLRSPALEAADLERRRTEAITDLQVRKGEPSALAALRLNAGVLQGHPYGAQADEASLSGITLQDVRSFHNLHVRPEGAILAASGDVSADELRILAEKHFGSWQGAPSIAPLAQIPALGPDPDAAANGMTIDLIAVPPSRDPDTGRAMPSPQSSIRVGHRSISRSHPDYLAATLMNFILGDAPSVNRLAQNLRERNSWTYDAGSAIEVLKQGGMFVAETDVQTDATAPALREILLEMKRMQDELVPAEELEVAKTMLASIFVIRQQKLDSIATQAAGIALHELPADTLATYRERIAALTAEDVQRAAREHLRPSELRVVVAGDAAAVRGPLGEIAPVRVFDVRGRPVSDAPATGR